MEKKVENCKMCVVGIGGVGGIIGGALAKKYPHISFYARGARKESIQGNGLIIESERMGCFQVRPEKVTDQPDELGIMDFIFICVKNYSLEQVCKQISPMVGEKTVIIPIMNGIDPAERVRDYLHRGTVLNALIYIASGSRDDFSIVQVGNYTNVHIGLKNSSLEEKESMEMVNVILNGAGIDCFIDDNIEVVVWKKFVLNCAFNILTAFYQANTSDLRRNLRIVQEYRSLLKEACIVGRKIGVKLPENLEEEHVKHFLYIQSDDATSSLRRDIELKKANELETFSGYLLKMGEQYELKLPATEYFYRELKKRA